MNYRLIQTKNKNKDVILLRHDTDNDGWPIAVIEAFTSYIDGQDEYDDWHYVEIVTFKSSSRDSVTRFIKDFTESAALEFLSRVS